MFNARASYAHKFSLYMHLFFKGLLEAITYGAKLMVGFGTAAAAILGSVCALTAVPVPILGQVASAGTGALVGAVLGGVSGLVVGAAMGAYSGANKAKYRFFNQAEVVQTKEANDFITALQLKPLMGPV